MDGENKEEKKIPEAEGPEEEQKAVSKEELKELIDHKDVAGLRAVFETVPDIDIAEAADDLEPTDLIYIFRNVEAKNTASFYDELNQDAKEALVRTMTDKELIQVINAQSADDVADTVGEMPANLASRVLKAADKDMRKDVNLLLHYQEDTAGAIMTTEFLLFLDTTTADEAIAAIRERGKEAETVYTLFVKNKSRDFVGTVDLDDLIWAKKDQPLSEIMNRDVVYCTTSTDQEEVGQMFRRYDLNALAVLNEDQKLIGIITIDDAVDVMTEESNEDMARLTNMEPADKPYMELSAWENAKRSFPWLIALLVLGTFTTMVLNRLEAQQIFMSLPILISFVPTLMDTGGNAGGQTTGIMIRGLALKEFGPRDWARIMWKELKAGLINGLITASFAFLWVSIEQYTGLVKVIIPDQPAYARLVIWNGSAFTSPVAGAFAAHVFTFAALVACTMFIAIVVSKMIGTLLPCLAAALKKDPALLSQPMLTTVMDVATLLIYFAMACLFFPSMA